MPHKMNTTYGRSSSRLRSKGGKRTKRTKRKIRKRRKTKKKRGRKRYLGGMMKEFCTGDGCDGRMNPLARLAATMRHISPPDPGMGDMASGAGDMSMPRPGVRGTMIPEARAFADQFHRQSVDPSTTLPRIASDAAAGAGAGSEQVYVLNPGQRRIIDDVHHLLSYSSGRRAMDEELRNNLRATNKREEREELEDCGDSDDEEAALRADRRSGKTKPRL